MRPRAPGIRTAGGLKGKSWSRDWWQGRDSNPRPRHYEVRRHGERQGVITSCVERRSAFVRCSPMFSTGCPLRGTKSGTPVCSPEVTTARNLTAVGALATLPVSWEHDGTAFQPVGAEVGVRAKLHREAASGSKAPEKAGTRATRDSCSGVTRYVSHRSSAG